VGSLVETIFALIAMLIAEDAIVCMLPLDELCANEIELVAKKTAKIIEKLKRKKVLDENIACAP
jgi:type IV secretory pathway component VirB8